jgi:acetolactate synthase I/II/III large subunit
MEIASVADLIVQRLLDAGAAALFGVPGGGGNLDLIDAARRAGLPFVLTTTETGAAIAALAQAEVTGRIGACLTTLGPGVSSAVNGIACAHLERVPLLVFTDCYGSAAATATHQRLNHHALLASIVKWSAIVSADNAGDMMAEAIRRATTGQPGPVHVDVPGGMASHPVDQSPVNQSQSPVDQSTVPNHAVWPTEEWRQVTGRLATARRPLLLVGLGARRPDDAAAIREFCTTRGIPAMVSYKAKGVVPDRDPHFAGVFTNAAIEQPILNQADLLVSVGLDSVELIPRRWPNEQPLVNICRWRDLGDHIPWTAQLVTEPSDGLRQVSEHLPAAQWDLDALQRSLADQRDRLRSSGTVLTADLVVRTAAASAPGVRVTVDAGAHMFAATMLWPIDEANGMLISNGLSTMGFALPAAIGAALHDRTQPVIALTGDGGLLMCAGELLTAARERLRTVVIVFNDSSLSLIAVKQAQRKMAAGGVALGEVAWCALAESLGVAAALVHTERDLTRALEQALAHDGPTLIEARVDPAPYADTLRAIRG